METLKAKTMNKIEELSAQLDSSFRESVDMEGRALFRRLIVLLAEGQPLSVERIAFAVKRPRDEVAVSLRRLPSLEWDKSGQVVGAGLTLRPTPHHFILNGRTLYTWCALDALMFPALLEQTVQVESPCVTTGTPVRVTVTPNGVEQVEPPEAVVSLVSVGASADIRRAFCDYVNFFSSNEAATAWLSSHPAATTLPVGEAYQLDRLLAQSIFEV